MQIPVKAMTLDLEIRPLSKSVYHTLALNADPQATNTAFTTFASIFKSLIQVRDMVALQVEQCRLPPHLHSLQVVPDDPQMQQAGRRS